MMSVSEKMSILDCFVFTGIDIKEDASKYVDEHIDAVDNA